MKLHHQTSNLECNLNINLINDRGINDKRNLTRNSFISTSTSIIVKATDTISTIFSILGISPTQNILIHKNNTLCPAFSFSFYKIRNNDTINIIETQNNFKNHDINTNNSFYPKEPKNNFEIYKSKQNSSKINKTKSINFLSIDDKEGFSQEIKGHIENEHEGSRNTCYFGTTNESNRLTDIHRFRIESNTKSFRKLCTRYFNLTKSNSSNLFNKPTNNSLTSNFETVLPEKPSLPSTDFLPSFN